MGVQRVTLIDHDRVERHNLDRLVHATTADIGERKVDRAGFEAREPFKAVAGVKLVEGRPRSRDIF